MENFGEETPNAHTLDATVNIKGLSAKFCLSVYPLLSLSIDPSLFFDTKSLIWAVSCSLSGRGFEEASSSSLFG